MARPLSLGARIRPKAVARGADRNRLDRRRPDASSRQPRPIQPAAVLGPVKAKPQRVAAKTRPALTGPARGGCENCGRDGRMLAARVEPKNGPLNG
jgi:hypothetical protein